MVLVTFELGMTHLLVGERLSSLPGWLIRDNFLQYPQIILFLRHPHQSRILPQHPVNTRPVPPQLDVNGHLLFQLNTFGHS